MTKKATTALPRTSHVKVAMFMFAITHHERVTRPSAYLKPILKSFDSTRTTIVVRALEDSVESTFNK